MEAVISEYKALNRACFILVFASFLISISVSGQTLTISNYSIKDGLSQASVTSFEQDSDGFLWVGTRDGLNRFDGFEFDVIRHQINDSTSLSHNYVTDVKEADDGTLWVGTIFGLNLLDRRSFQSTAYYHWFEDSTSISSNNIRCIEKGTDGKMWVGTENGLNLFSPEGKLTKSYGISKDNPSTLSSNRINDLSADKSGNIWVATEGGLNLVLSETDSVIRYLRPFDEFFRPGDNDVISLECLPDGRVWLGTRNGLAIFNPESSSFKALPLINAIGLEDGLTVQTISKSPDGGCWVGTPLGLIQFNQEGKIKDRIVSQGEGESLLRSTDISDIFFDHSGLLWVGTKSSGLTALSDDLPVFKGVNFPVSEGYKLGSNNITAICSNLDDSFLLGTETGFKKLKKEDNKELRVVETPKNFTPFESYHITSLAQNDSLIWVGTQNNGVAIYRRDDGDIKYFRYNPEDKTGLTSNRIEDVLLDSEGNAWVATRGGGLCFLNYNSDLVRNFRFEGATPNTLRDNNITSLAADSLENIWVGTANGGLFSLDVGTEKFRAYSIRKEEGGLGSNSINDLHFDGKNVLWVATSGGGLCELHPGSRNFKVYSSEDGLINDVVLAVGTDDFGYVWITTNTGITRFDSENQSFKNYLDFQLAGDNTFNARSMYIDNKGLALYGGGNGLSYLDVTNIKSNQFRPKTAITSCQLLGGETRNLQKKEMLFSGDTLKLEYNHSGFEIEFASLNFLNPEKNKYKYRLLGLFNRWRPSSDTRKATFSSLNPGLYEFEVMGSNNDGLWSESPARLTILVNPAFWQTLWFQLTAAVLIIGLLFLVYRYRISMETIRRHELEKAVKQRTSEIARERDTNAILLQEIHHRVKNNLQIIVSLLSLQSRFITNTALLNTFSEIQNRIRSMSLIHQKMYKTEDLKSINIEEYIRDLSNNLVSTYRLTNQIDLDVNVEVNNFNSDTLTPLGLIINEVISNALKYAFEEDRVGKITVSLKKVDNKKYEMLIGDDGVGLDENILEKADESFGTELIIALVEQLNGTIELMNTQKGTCYRIIFEDVG